MNLRRRPISRWALWLFAAALLLKAAMPMLATASAGVQGKALVEVCTVYGMSMVKVDGDSPGANNAPTKPGDLSAHLDHHCALTALAVLAMADDPPATASPGDRRSSRPLPASGVAGSVRDAAAAWVAGRKQGPPNRS